MQTIPYTVVRDIALDDTGDWQVSGGDLQLIGDGPSITQAVRIALEFFMGEWFLDQTAGIPYYQSVFVKNPDVNLLRQIFNDEIAGVPGILSVNSLAINFDRATRELFVTYTASSSTGPLADTVALQARNQ